MKIVLTILILLLVAQSSSAYPQNELGSILREKYPDADFTRDIIIVQEGGTPHVLYSIYSIPDGNEMELLWQKAQEKRLLEAQNQIEKLLSKQDLQIKYQNQIDNLNTVINNSNYIQSKTNWTNADIVSYMKVLAWNDEVQAKGQIAILRILRWMLW